MKKTRSPQSVTKAPVAPQTRSPTYEDLIAIARLVESGSRFTEFRLRSGDIEVEVKRAVAPAAPAPAPAAAAPPPGQQADSPPAAEPELPAGTQVVRSPMAGTAYRSPLPGAPHFVEPGSRVEADTIVCIVEVMKLMNSVPAGVAGEVTHILFEDAQPVAPGQALVAIREAP